MLHLNTHVIDLRPIEMFILSVPIDYSLESDIKQRPYTLLE